MKIKNRWSGETYEVYKIREHIERCEKCSNQWTGETVEFLIYTYDEWNWVKAKDYFPVVE